MFADDIVSYSERRKQVEEYLEKKRKALEKREMKVSRRKNTCVWMRRLIEER